MMRWLGTGLQIAGAIALASHMVEPYFAYFIMLPGAVILAIIYASRDDWAQVALQATFVIINLTGMWSWSA